MRLFKHSKFYFLCVVAVGFLATSCLGPNTTEAGPAGPGSTTAKDESIDSEPDSKPDSESEPDTPASSDTPPEAPSSSEPEASDESKADDKKPSAGPSKNQPSDRCNSNGSGGPSTSVVQTFTASTGVSSSYRLYPTKSSGASGLLLYLHGDGAYSYDNPNSMQSMREVAAKHNLTMIVPLVPDGSSKSWWQQPDRNSTWVRELIENVAYGQYEIDKSRVVLSGFSGGTDFLSRYFISGHWDVLPCGGGAVLMGGGGQPFEIKNKTFGRPFKDDFNLHYYTGLADNGVASGTCKSTYDALETSRSGASYYQGQGFTTTSAHPAGVDHCNVDQAKVVDQQISGTLLP